MYRPLATMITASAFLGTLLLLQPCIVAQAGHIDATLRPFDWYRTLVLLGALRLGLPEDYVARVGRWPCRDDFDPGRRVIHERLIARIRAADGREA